MNRREEIYERSLELFISRGYDNTPISLIARELGLTKAGLYHYIQNKQELLFFIHDYHLKKHYIPIIESAEQISDPQERLAFFLKKYTKLLTNDASGRVLVHEVRRLKPEHYDIVTEVWKRMFNLVRGAIAELEINGRCKKINKTFSTFAAVGMCSWTFYWYDYSRKESAEELSDSYVDIFFKGILKG